MQAYHITGPGGLDALQQIELRTPEIGTNDVLVDMQAWSLNYRDLSMPHGGYGRNEKVKTNPPLIPLSDAAGEVVAVGAAVTRFKVGDRVAGCFFQNWLDGELSDAQIGSALGGAIDGVLAEQVAFNEQGLVRIPEHLDYQQAACLPCAALTAWQALTLAGLKAGATILLLGTGGVWIFGLQLAKASGAKVIITSSSDEKLASARELGADETINYKTHPNWDHAVRDLTGGVGVDNVLEVGGAGTLEKSMHSARVSGTVSLIGVLSGRPAQNPSPLSPLFKRLTIQGIYVGSKAMFEDLNAALAVNHIVPIIDKVYPFAEARAAYEYLQSGRHFGKVVIAQ